MNMRWFFVVLFCLMSAAACQQPPIPPTPTVLPATTNTPIAAATTPPTATPTPFPISDPPGCSAHDLVYHTTLEAVVLVNCLDQAVADLTPSRLWGWNGTQWVLLSTDGPPSRLLGGVAYDRQRALLLVLGGRALTADYTDFWTWDGQQWQPVNSPGPGNLSNHFSMSYDPDRDRVVLYGGQDLSERTYTNTWEWDGAQWQMLAETGPSLNIHYALAYDATRQQMLLLGEGANQLWDWDGQSWQHLDSPISPPTRAGARMAHHAATGQTVLFGGRDYGRRVVLGDTWLWDGEQWIEWTGAGPTPRSHHSMAYDEARGRVVLYGGEDVTGRLFNDTWEWDGETWQCVHQCGRGDDESH